METEGTNLPLLTCVMSDFWSLCRWPRATYKSSRRHRSIPLGGRYRQVSLYLFIAKLVFNLEIPVPGACDYMNMSRWWWVCCIYRFDIYYLKQDDVNENIWPHFTWSRGTGNAFACITSRPSRHIVLKYCTTIALGMSIGILENTE